jgi:hypothetical protein
MPYASDRRFLALHGLRLKGFGEVAAVAAAVNADEATVAELLPALQLQELVLRRDGRLAGWALTAAGRAEQQQLAADDLAASGTHALVDDAYRRFLDLNGDLLEACTRWQMRGSDRNDHTDVGYDAEVVAQLRAIHDKVQPILDDLVGGLERFAAYGPRFTTAIEAVEAGDTDRFTKPLIDSYHTIWFELHEDLLTSLGIERSQEATT